MFEFVTAFSWVHAETSIPSFSWIFSFKIILYNNQTTLYDEIIHTFHGYDQIWLLILPS